MLAATFNQWQIVPEEWNVIAVHGKHSPRLIERAKLLHWAGQSKPWDKFPGDNICCVDIWQRYAIEDCQ